MIVSDQNLPRHEEALPLIEIQEELDEDDNVISEFSTMHASSTSLKDTIASLTTTPSDAAQKLQEVLRKARVQDLLANDQSAIHEKISINNTDSEVSSQKRLKIRSSSPPAQSGRMSSTDHRELDTRAVETASSSKSPASANSSRRKSVTFAEGTKKPHNPKDPSEAKQQRNLAIRSRANDKPSAKHSPSSIPLYDILLSERNESEVEPSPPVIPNNESPEDATLRRQMLQYSMNEVGAVVAEIKLDDEDTDTPPYSDDEDDYNYAGSSTEEEEDEFGRTKKRVVSEDYRRQMLKLQQRLNTKPVENYVSGHYTTTPSVIQPKTPHSNASKSTGQSHPALLQGQESKVVRFAEEIDIQDNSSNGTHSKPQTQDNLQDNAPIHDDIIERAIPKNQADTATTIAKRKVSRFKSARGDIAADDIYTPPPPSSHPPLPTNPTTTSPPSISTTASLTVPPDPLPLPNGQIHATAIIERPSNPTIPLEPDDLDPALLRQEVSTEYHRLRNRMIQRQGGFMAEEEGPETRLSDEEDGGRKISRFKAARLGRSI